VAGRLNGNGLVDRIHTQVDSCKGRNLPELFLNLFLPKVSEVEVDIRFSSNASALPNLRENGAGDDVPRGQVFDRGGLTFHERFAEIIAQNPALTPCGLTHQDPERIEARGMKLYEFHIFEGDSRLEGSVEPIAR
jgi:hypothetical protein